MLNRFKPRQMLRSAAISALHLKYLISGRERELFSKNRVQFIYFHYILPDEEKAFGKVLSELSKTHVFISHSEAVDRIRSGHIDKQYLSVSFDDGFKNCLKAAEIMDAYGIKGCFFIIPSIVGEKDPKKISSFCREKLHRLPADFLDWDDVTKLLSKGHEIGSHGMTHSKIAGMDQIKLVEEITGSFALLKGRIGDVRHFSWPYGKFSDFSGNGAKLVFDSGFVSCSSAQRGCHTVPEPDIRSLCIRRDHVIAAWPLSHVKYFIAKSSEASGENTGKWPQGWSV